MKEGKKKFGYKSFQTTSISKRNKKKKKQSIKQMILNGTAAVPLVLDQNDQKQFGIIIVKGCPSTIVPKKGSKSPTEVHTTSGTHLTIGHGRMSPVNVSDAKAAISKIKTVKFKNM